MDNIAAPRPYPMVGPTIRLVIAKPNAMGLSCFPALSSKKGTPKEYMPVLPIPTTNIPTKISPYSTNLYNAFVEIWYHCGHIGHDVGLHC